MKSIWKQVFIVFTLAMTLQGCVAVVGGAAIGIAGASVIYDRRELKSMWNDQKISQEITAKLANTKELDAQSHIVVSTFHGTVLLVGQVPKPELKKLVADVAKTIPNIKRMYNEITIDGPTAALIHTSDSWITTKVKARFLATKALKSGQFKVVTENGTVFLMGIVNRKQAQKAIDIARHVSGVQKVVKVFEYKR